MRLFDNHVTMLLPESPYGRVSEKEAYLLRRLVSGRAVYDLGAGFCGLAAWLRPYAERIVAVDKAPMPPVYGIVQVQAYFVDWAPTEPIDIALLSWPVNHRMPGLIEILEEAGTVIYRGENDLASACGDAGLFRYLSGREVLAHYEHDALDKHHGCLTVYGSPCAERELTPEEHRVLREPRESWRWPLQEPEESA